MIYNLEIQKNHIITFVATGLMLCVFVLNCSGLHQKKYNLETGVFYEHNGRLRKFNDATVVFYVIRCDSECERTFNEINSYSSPEEKIHMSFTRYLSIKHSFPHDLLNINAIGTKPFEKHIGNYSVVTAKPNWNGIVRIFLEPGNYYYSIEIPQYSRPAKVSGISPISYDSLAFSHIEINESEVLYLEPIIFKNSFDIISPTNFSKINSQEQLIEWESVERATFYKVNFANGKIVGITHTNRISIFDFMKIYYNNEIPERTFSNVSLIYINAFDSNGDYLASSYQGIGRLYILDLNFTLND